MIKFLTNTIKRATELSKFQSELLSLTGKRKKSDFVKVRIPKEYMPMITMLATYGINNTDELQWLIKTYSLANEIKKQIEIYKERGNFFEQQLKKYPNDKDYHREMFAFHSRVHTLDWVLTLMQRNNH